MNPMRLEKGALHRVLVTLVALVAYALLPTKLYFWDGVSFSLNIEAPGASLASLFNPNHLTYNLIGYTVWKGLSAFGIAVRVLPLLQALNAVFAAATVFLLWGILRKITHSTSCSTWSALIFAFSATWWKFATDADAYILSIFFLVLSYRWVAMGSARPMAAGVAHAAAMLVHQLAIFFVPVALLGIAKSGHAGRRQRLFAAAQYAITAGSITAVAYVSAFVLWSPAPANARGFWRWITVHSEDAPFFTLDLLRSALLTLRGTVRLMFGGRFTFVRPDPLTICAALAFCAAAGLALSQISRKEASPNDVSRRPVAWIEANRLPLIWLSCYVVFLAFGRPQDTFHRLFYLPPLVLLIGEATSRRSGRVKWMAILSTAMAVSNLIFYISPYTKTENNEILAFALDHRKDWTPGSVIAYGQFHSDLWTISYFNPQASWVAIPSPTIAEVESRRSDAGRNGNSLWLEETARDGISRLPGGAEWLELNVDRSRSLIKETPRNKLRFYRVR
jgi:hypothetical protein